MEGEETGEVGNEEETATAVLLPDEAPDPESEAAPGGRGPGRRVRCPACGGHGEALEGGAGEEGKEGVCRCDGCAALFLNPRPSVGEVLAVRNARFKGALRANHGHEIRAQLEAAQEAMRGYHRLVSGKDAALNAFGRKVLDLGCGLGFRMREFIGHGWTAVGLEPSVNARAYTGALMLEVADADFGTPPPGSFDLILMEDLLDEVPEPGAVVAAARKVLGPRGVLSVSVREPGEEDVIPEGKLCHLGADALRRLVMPLGFSEPEEKTEDGILRLWFRAKGN